jgi:drug/metabolite transporter (DMT)-like permease
LKTGSSELKPHPMQKALRPETRPALASRYFANPYLLLTLTMLFWAGNSIAGRGVRDVVPPLALAWLRWTLAALIVLPFAWPHLKRDLPVIRAHWRVLFLLGAIGAGTFVTIYYYGLTLTPATNALIINSGVPILIPLASYALYRDRLTAVQAAGIALSLAGVLTVLSKGDPSALLSLDLNHGDLWILGSMLVWAVYTALLREQPAMHWLSFAWITFFVASAVNLVPFALEHLFVRQIQPTVEALIGIAYVSTLPSIVAQIFFIRGVELIGANRAGAFMNFIPMFGAVLAVLILGETLYLFHLAGFALILAGVTLASRSGGRV